MKLNSKPLLAIALQMILWHTTTNGGTMLYHGRGEGKIEDNGQSQELLQFETNQQTDEVRHRMKFESEAQETFTNEGDVIRFKYEADRVNTWSSGVRDFTRDPLDPDFGDYDPDAIFLWGID